MLIFTPLLFGISASLDALIVGMTYGLRRVRICLWQNFLISLITLLGTCMSVGLGGCLSPLLPSFISPILGSAVLICFGIYYLVKAALQFLPRHRNRKNLIISEIQSSLSVPEIISLGTALSINNMGIGFSASIAGLPLIPTAATTLVCSVSFLFFGNRMGSMKLFRLAGSRADLLSGLLLTGLGICELYF